MLHTVSKDTDVTPAERLGKSTLHTTLGAVLLWTEQQQAIPTWRQSMYKAAVPATLTSTRC